MMPLVSIITPAYNAAATLQETVNSVYVQSFQDWEWCIADDGSTDGTPDMLRELAARDPRVRLFFMPRNGGAPAALNAALQQAQGRYAAVLDTDDVWLPEKLARQVSFMQEKKAPISFTGHRRMSEDGTKCGPFIRPPRRMAYHDLLKNTAIVDSSVMLDREIIGPFSIRETKSRGSYDLATWLALMASGHVAYGLDEDLMRYRVRRFSISSNKFKTISRVWWIYREQEKLSFPYAAWCLAGYGFHAVAKRMGIGRMPWA
jgi:teichuronic acid biosynthesis glycosyltransferase TuaG